MNRDADTAEAAESRTAIFVGRRNAGKTTIFHAASLTRSLPSRDAFDGTEECETSNFRVGTVHYKLVDTQGFRGEAAEDKKVLAKIQKTLKTKAGSLNALFIVTSFHRFEPQDANVIEFVCSTFSPAVRSKAVLIIMSCGHNDREKAIKQLVDDTTMFGKISDFRDRERQVLNFDLPDFNSFTKEELQNNNFLQLRYERARDAVRKAIIDSEMDIAAEDVFAQAPSCVVS